MIARDDGPEIPEPAAPNPDVQEPYPEAKAPGAGARGPGAGGWRRPDASMSLLLDLFAGKILDPGYTEAAARRAASGEGPRARGRFRGGGILLILLLVGVLLAVAGAEVRRGEPVAAERRARLIDEIHVRTGETDGLQRRLDRLRAETERRRAAALARSDAGRRARQRLAEARAAAAGAPAAGPGLVITLDDARHGEPDAGGGHAPDDGRVYDQDLQVVVNGLWAAGARAIGINGQRITPVTAIRTAGEAVLVDYRPLRTPYEVTALGEPREMEDAFDGSDADRWLRRLEERYRIAYGTHRAGRVRLPAAAGLRLRYAAPREGR
ncbi:DUF881 domain-containing protein [Actinomadura graeca]|uniref:DUF881 domain-containing protein n=1 Tax=Actinomadura graeca TaxID=2750812 RepID=A0ABX8QMG3_9ACTN|nr:DUF881 domain-containing protein [Actinomadura graeca]QXJ19541.1 DUF881 domain-containing protein [Actinomadura graeca]